MVKNNRQQEIRRLIENKIIVTQDDLQAELVNLGYKITQSTISRDMKELHVVKGHDQSGNYRYIISESNALNSNELNQYREMFARAVKSIDYALNTVVVKCYNGMASGACVVLDKLFSDYTLGTLAGDDTIIAVTRSEEKSVELVKEINKIL